MEISAVQTKKTRKDYLDYAKAIGIFLVVWGHLLPRQADPSRIASEIKIVIYSFHMPLFFAISGAGLWYKLKNSEPRNLKMETKKLAGRLLAPYLFWCIVYTALRLIVTPFGIEWLMKAESAAGDILFGSIAPLWFLYTLFMSEVVFLWLWNRLKNKGKEKSIFAWGGGIAPNRRYYATS